MRTEWAHRLGQEESWGADHVKRHPLPPQRVNKLSREKKKKKNRRGKSPINSLGSVIQMEATYPFLTPWEGYTFFGVKQSLMALVNHSASCNYQAGEPQRASQPLLLSRRQWGLQAESPLCHTMAAVPAASATHAERTPVLKSLLLKYFSGFGAQGHHSKNPTSFRKG